jgi:N-acetylmuramoyl-L-alanine amidase
MARSDHARLSRRGLLAGGVALGAALAVSPLTGDVLAEAAVRNLRRGDRGADVRTLQRRLRDVGYWCGGVDGVFGHLTQQAVWAVQKQHRLVRDGIVGPRTRSALAGGGAPRPVSITGSGVEVHLRRQLLVAVSGGRTVATLNTSSGNGEYYWLNGRRYRATTPTGRYRVYSTYSNGWQPGPLGDLYRPMYFNGGIAVHGSLDIPTWPDSHGCCRVSVAAMDMLWSTGRMTHGTRVVVATGPSA